LKTVQACESTFASASSKKEYNESSCDLLFVFFVFFVVKLE